MEKYPIKPTKTFKETCKEERIKIKDKRNIKNIISDVEVSEPDSNLIEDTGNIILRRFNTNGKG